jgi:hypothetical protein
VKVDYVVAAGRLVQTVDVLSDELRDPTVVLEGSERPMRVVGARDAHAFPADETSRPVTLARVLARQKVLQRHRLRALPFAVGTAIVRNARRRAAAGAGQDEEPLVPLDELLQRTYSVSPLAATSQLGFVQRAQSLPTNIRAAFLSLLNCHLTQFDATFAYSPPPG